MNRCSTGDAVVTSTQPRDKLGDRGSKNDKIPTTVWKKYEAERRKESEEREESSNSRRRKDCEMGSRQQRGLGKKRRRS